MAGFVAVRETSSAVTMPSFQVGLRLSSNLGKPAINGNTRFKRSIVGVPTCSLGPTAPRGGSGSLNGPLASSRHRVQALTAEAPPMPKEAGISLPRDLDAQKERLQAVYGASIDVWVAGVGSGETERGLLSEPKASESPVSTKTAPGRRRSSRSARTSRGPVNEPTSQDSGTILVPSTRRGTSRHDRTFNAKTSRGLRDTLAASQPLPGTQRSPEAVGETDELTADIAFLSKLRDWLRTKRVAGRSQKRPSGIDCAPSMSSSVSRFMTSLGDTPVLTSSQEKRLARIIVRGNGVRRAAALLARASGRRPSLEEVAGAADLPSAQAAARAVVLGEDARSLMAEFNFRMVLNLARRYTGKGLDMGDLIPEGIAGLHRAIDKFDPSKGFKFSTYAHYWIRQAITRAISDQSRDVRLPVHIVEFLVRLRRVTSDLQSQPDRTEPPTYQEMAKAMGVPLSRLVGILRMTRAPKTPEDSIAMGGELKDSKSAPASDIWAAADDYGEDYAVENERDEFLRETMTLMLSTLPVREANILRLRFGLNPIGNPQSLEAALIELLGKKTTADADDDADLGLNLHELGSIHKLSRERIRQIEAGALRHLRSPWRLNLLRRAKMGEELSDENECPVSFPEEEQRAALNT